jgi:hypothetical protein
MEFFKDFTGAPMKKKYNDEEFWIKYHNEGSGEKPK